MRVLSGSFNKCHTPQLQWQPTTRYKNVQEGIGTLSCWWLEYRKQVDNSSVARPSFEFFFLSSQKGNDNFTPLLHRNLTVGYIFLKCKESCVCVCVCVCVSFWSCHFFECPESEYCYKLICSYYNYHFQIEEHISCFNMILYIFAFFKKQKAVWKKACITN